MLRVARALPYAVALSAVGIVTAAAQTTTPVSDTVNRPTRGAATIEPPPRPNAIAQRIRGNRIDIDGRLDEDIWRSAPPIGAFTQKQPVEGGPLTDSTVVRIAYDDGAMYVGARMYSKDPRAIQAPVGRRDNIGAMENLLISLDTYLDRRTAYTFAVTASGVRGDWYHSVDDENSQDASWDPVWQAKTRIDSLGWTAEMRIPFTQLRFNDAPVQRWGVNVRRWIPSRNEADYWIAVPKKVRAWSSRFGDLSGIEGIPASHRVELFPYVASSARLVGDRHPGNPFDDGAHGQVRVGGDLKMGLGPSLTLQATVNPDFGQVEADPAVVNLSAFEINFPERRPFFTEGANLLRGGGNTYFYSRRIGAQTRSPGGDFSNPPEPATILGAAKITGRLRSGLSVGALAAVTDRESAIALDTAYVDGGGATVPESRTRVRVAPRSTFGVVRAQQEFGRSRSTAGVVLTGVQRSLEDGDPLESIFNRDAFTGAADWNLRLLDAAYEFSGSVGFSHVAGDSTAMLRLQRSSARYYQRPDADYVEVDSAATSLAGYTTTLSLERISGTHWLWDADVGLRSPGFELNDIGFQSTADQKYAIGQIQYRETKPNRLLQSYGVSLSSENTWDYGNERTFASFVFEGLFTFNNFWSLSQVNWIDARGMSKTLTRGGPYMQTGNAWVNITELGNSSAAKTRVRGRVYYGESEVGERTYRLSGGVSVRPGPRWQLSVDPNYLRSTNPRQYITRLADGSATTTIDDRYVFSTIDLSEFSLPFRINYTLRPDLTLELYAQPYAANGKYFHFGQLHAPRSKALDDYATDGTVADGVRTIDVGGGEQISFGNSDFNERSLRSNAVMRWEWRPGSTLFVVWQQDGYRAEDRIRTIRPADPFDSFRGSKDNFFAVKMNFWIPM